MRWTRTYIIALWAVLALAAVSGHAQHSTLNSQYMFNGLVINPAYAGAQNTMAVNINYRNQWTGFEGAPVSQMASFHSPIPKKAIALGAMLTREEVGVSTDIALRGQISYKMKLDRKKSIRFGIGAGLASTTSRWTDVVTEEMDDPLFQHDVSGVIRPLFSTGVYYETKEWYLGYSMPSIMRYEYRGSDKIESKFSLSQTEHILHAGYAYKINRKLVIKPSILLRTIPTSGAQVDINANLIIRNKLWTGLSYRHKESAIALLEYQVHHQFRVGYAYDFNIGPIGAYSSGSHELMLSWVFRQQSFARNPRYF